MRGAHRDAAGLIREAVGLVRTAPAGLAVLDQIEIVLIDDAQELTLGGVELIEACVRRGVDRHGVRGSGRRVGSLPRGDSRELRTPGSTPRRDLGAGRRAPGHRMAGGSRAPCHAAHRRGRRGGAPDGAVACRRRRLVRALLLRSPAEEYDAIARMLRERHVHDGVAWADCAVIAHDSRQVAALEAELAAREVPARSNGPGQALGRLAPVRDLLRLIEAAARDEWTDEEVSELLLGTCGRLDPIELRRLRSALRHAALQSSAVDSGSGAAGAPSGNALLVSAMHRPLEFDLIDTREARRAALLARTLGVLRDDLERGATVHELLWTAWDRSGLERAWSELARGHGPLAEQANRDLDAVVALFQAAKRFVERSLDADPRAFVRGMLDSDVAEDRLDAPMRDDTVRILTPAGSLGLEFDTVVIAGVQDGVWPNTRLRGGLLDTWRLVDAASRADGESSGTLDRRRAAMHDELRLLARALSRATALVLVTAVDDDDTGPSVFFEFLPEPERHTVDHPLSLRGLVAQHRRALTVSAGGQRAARPAGQLAVLAAAGVPGAAPVEWYGVAGPTSTGPLRDLALEDVRVSPSRLHTLEECELNWVIGDLGGDPGGATAGLGTIIHAALEHADATDEASLWAQVEARWGELTFEAEWRDRAERIRARDLVRRLHVYLRRFEQSGGTLIGAEPHFEVAIPLEEAEAFEHGVILSGYIDRVELTPEGAVVIVDLKTGKREPQTDAKVVDNPQLGAYQLAFEAGAIEQAAGHPSGGAKLLVLRPTAARSDYAEPWQPPFDDERREQFLGRIRQAVSVMRGSSFTAPYEEHCRDEFSYGLCRIHTVGAVSAS